MWPFGPKIQVRFIGKFSIFAPVCAIQKLRLDSVGCFFNEELQKKILKLLSSRHVIFCLTMCNRKQDLVFFSFCLPNQPTKLLLCTTTARVVIPHFMRRQLLCEKITISGGQVYIWLQSRYSPAQNYFFIKSVLM